VPAFYALLGLRPNSLDIIQVSSLKSWIPQGWCKTLVASAQAAYQGTASAVPIDGPKKIDWGFSL
jgi:hypothetical protein